MKNSIVLLATVMLCIGCAHSKKFNTDNARVSKTGVFTMDASWVKEKKKRFDVGLNLTNEGKKPVLVSSNDMHCSRGGAEGDVTGFGEHGLGIAPGQSSSVTLHCTLGTVVKEGSFKIELKKIYANPSGDAVTRGAEVATNLVLVMEHEKDKR